MLHTIGIALLWIAGIGVVLAAGLFVWAVRTPNLDAARALRLSSEDPRHPMNNVP